MVAFFGGGKKKKSAKKTQGGVAVESLSNAGNSYLEKVRKAHANAKTDAGRDAFNEAVAHLDKGVSAVARGETAEA